VKTWKFLPGWRQPFPQGIESLCLEFCQAKTFIRKEVKTLAISKQRKEEVLNQYNEWLDKSQAVILVEYTGITMKEFDNIRAKVRESGGEFHVLKNTLARKAFESRGISVSEKTFEKSTAAVFAFGDVAGAAKALSDVTKSIEFVKVKGGVMDNQSLSMAQVKSLASMPPLPVVQALLLGVLQAPAGKLVRTLAEPARQVASVLKAYSDKNAASTAA
jgi:large subunit ribosomal protein L10